MSDWNPNLPDVELPKRKKRKRKARPKPKKRGRRRIKRAFSETTLGRSLRLNAPLEYDLITHASDLEPEADFIESVAYSSLNPYFKGALFRRLLIKYRQNGCTQSWAAKEPDADTIRRYVKVRRARMMRFSEQ